MSDGDPYLNLVDIDENNNYYSVASFKSVPSDDNDGGVDDEEDADSDPILEWDFFLTSCF